MLQLIDFEKKEKDSFPLSLSVFKEEKKKQEKEEDDEDADRKIILVR